MTKVSVEEARRALNKALPGRGDNIELVNGRLPPSAFDPPYPAHRAAFSQLRQIGEWAPQVFLFNLEGELLATYVLPAEDGIKAFLAKHGDEPVADKYTPLWVAMFPFTYAWKEVQRVQFVVDSWMTNVDTGRKIEALTVHDMTPTRVETNVWPYTVGRHVEFQDDEHQSDDAEMKGPLMDTFQAAIDARLDVQGDSLPAWFATSVLAECGYDVLLFPESWPSLDEVDFDHMNDLNSIMFHLIREAQS